MAVSIRPPASVSVVGVRSEAGRLRRVLVHRPGRELDRLTPGNAADLLFDDVVSPDLAREEHDILVATLVEAGTEVLYLGDLLAGRRRCGRGSEAMGRVTDSQVAELLEGFRPLASSRGTSPGIVRPGRTVGVQ